MAKAKLVLVINEQRLRTLEELRENFILAELIERFRGGQLRAWLHCWEFEAELEQLEALSPDLPDSELAEALCRIFGVEGDCKEKAFHDLKTWQEIQQLIQQTDQEIQEFEQLTKKAEPLVRWLRGTGELPSEEKSRDLQTELQKQQTEQE